MCNKLVSKSVTFVIALESMSQVDRFMGTSEYCQMRHSLAYGHLAALTWMILVWGWLVVGWSSFASCEITVHSILWYQTFQQWWQWQNSKRGEVHKVS
jgi:hypothetical protein